MRARILWLWCAAAVVAPAAPFTVDCNKDETDCDTEMKKIMLFPEYESNDDFQTTTQIFLPTALPTEATTLSPKENKELDVNNSTELSKESDQIKPKGRLINLSVDELQTFNSDANRSEAKSLGDLSDINLDDDEDDFAENAKLYDKMNNDKISSVFLKLGPFSTTPKPVDMESDGNCHENGTRYKVGETIEHGCEETCECMMGGNFDCVPRCKHPYIRKGRRLLDPLCFESPVDDCCSIIACASGNGEPKPQFERPDDNLRPDMCKYGNDTYAIGTKWHIGCEQTCSCDTNSVVTCIPRCPKVTPSDKCINVQDPHDSCCEVQICDVSQDAHEEEMEDLMSSTTERSEELPDSTTNVIDKTTTIKTTTSSTTLKPEALSEPIGSVTVLHNNSVQVTLMHMNNTEFPVHLLLSSDGGKTYSEIELKYSNLILDLEGGKDYVLKSKETGTVFNFTITASDLGMGGKIGCTHEGAFYAVGEEFHIGCSELCECTGNETRECAMLECPNNVGLELLSRGCVHWAPSPPPQPPNCCPRSARCLSDGTCHFKGQAIPNWSEVPIALTGCEQRCFCENGELECQEVCSPLPSLPPQTLRCPPLHHPAPVNISDEDCCKEWGCLPNAGATATPESTRPPIPAFLPTLPPDAYPHETEGSEYDLNDIHKPDKTKPEQDHPTIPGFPPGPSHNFAGETKKLVVLSLQSDSPTSVKMLFGLPPLLVGLRGSVDLRYTDTDDENVSHWYSQVFAPVDEILSTSRLEFRLTGLKPSTLYKIRSKLYLHNLPVVPESDIYSIRTLDMAPVEEKRREINSRLSVLEVNDTAAHVSWRHFSEDELLLIDGIQVRYRPVGTPIYLMTELLHHSRSAADLHDLRPGSKYEASLVLVPPPRAATELFDPTSVEFSTAEFVDPYNWSVSVEVVSRGAASAQVTWRGVPAPAARWVRVFRAAYACDHTRTEHDNFRLAARDEPPLILLQGLEPGSRCRIWLELFLTNGKVKTSNVVEINTKSLDTPEILDNTVEASSIAGGRGRGDYYGALVVVGVIAALGAVTSLLLLLIVVRRHRPRSVPITPVPTAPRESSLPPYDNPAYKLELQQETMDL